MVVITKDRSRASYTKLTPGQEKEIIESTETPKYLAYKYGCGLTTIYKIKNSHV